jgi:UDP-N-acetylmuramate dehydrogenase
MEKITKELIEKKVGLVKELEPLSLHTTMKIGGPADLLVEPSSVDKLQETMKIIREYNVTWRAIGRGSNLLVSDNGIEGVVIKLGKGMDYLEIEGNTVKVGGGYSLVVLAVQIAKKGLEGFEFAGGIPGSVGGAVYMNAGAHGSDISKILVKVHVLFPDGTMEWLTKDEMAFSYRTSLLQKARPGIVVEAVFHLNEGVSSDIKNQMKEYKEYRRNTQPWDHPCAGSIFRNPLPEHAGNLVEKAGLKGHQIGGAKISEMHGNFIVNTGNATCADVLALIEHVQNTIYDLHKIKMHTEVEIIGQKDQ